MPAIGSVDPRTLGAPLVTRNFLLLSLASCLFFSSYHLVTPAFPLFCQSLHLSGTTTGLLVGVFMLTSLLSRPWLGRLCDQYSKPRIMTVGAGLFLLTSPLYVVFPHVGALFIIRILQGIGFSTFYTASASYLTESIPANRRSEGISYHSNAVKLAIAFAPLVGLTLADRGQFGWVFAASALLGLVCWLATGLIANDTPPPAPRDTLLPMGKLINPKVFFPGSMIAINSLVFGALIPFAPLLAAEKHIDSPQWFYLVYALALILTRFLSAKTADRHGRAFVIVPGMVVVAASLLLLSTSNGLPAYLVAAGLYGLGAGVVQPALIAMAADRTEPHERGSAMATFTMFTDGGHGLGSLLMGWMSDIASLETGLLWVALVVVLGWVWFMVKERLLPLPRRLLPQ